jgi:hypothetical protein
MLTLFVLPAAICGGLLAVLLSLWTPARLERVEP